MVGQLHVGQIATSIFLFLPLFVFIFAIFYLFLSHLLNNNKSHKSIRPFLNKEFQQEKDLGNNYLIPISYRFLGILLIVSPVFLYFIDNLFHFIDNLLLMLFLVLLLGTYYLKTLYKIEVKDNVFIIYLISGKRIIKLDEVRSVKLGVIHNRVDCKGKFYYLSHFLKNVGFLTRLFAKNTGTQAFDQAKWDAIEKHTDSPSFWAYKTIFLLIFSILSSAFGVWYFISIAKQIH